MKTITASDYSIYFGKASFNLEDYSRIAILVDENTKQHCLPHFLESYPIYEPLIIEVFSGEENKTLESCQQIWEALTKEHVDRKALLINLGGGVIGDMGGFAASTYKRGIDFIQVPTTLLSMVDASIGGKLGIDFNGLKNQIGLFNNPKAVLIDSVYLNSLPHSQLLSGFAEVVKHALIADKDYWEHLTSTKMENLNWDSIILRSVQIKNEIVLADSLENGARKKLNFGHTLGHAIESHYLAEGKPILHGEAVALGMLLESRLSKLSVTETNVIGQFLESTFTLPEIPPTEKLMQWILHDKKNESGILRFSLLTEIGKCHFHLEVTPSAIHKCY